MMFKIYLTFYYICISKLPHSRLLKFSNSIRIWYCAKLLKILPFDTNSKFENNIYISNAKNLKIGKFCRINENVLLQGTITIGNYVMIAPNVAIHSSTHIYKDILQPMVTNGLSENKPVIIEDDVWIGRNVVILPGITIHKGSIIGANSVVTKNIEEYSIYGGVPAKFIKKRQ